jgi:hypothetical protein
LQQQLETDLKKRRADNLSKIKEHGDELKTVESDIYSTGCKLKCALEENENFSHVSPDQEDALYKSLLHCCDLQAVDKLNDQMCRMKAMIESNDSAVSGLLGELGGIKGNVEFFFLLH